MQRLRICTALLLSLVFPGSPLHAQTSTAPPPFSFSAPQKVFTGAANTSGDVSTEFAVDLNGDGNTDFFAQFTGQGSNANIFLIGDGKGGFTLNPNSNTNDPKNGNPFLSYGYGTPIPFVDFNHDSFADTLSINPGYIDTTNCGILTNGSVSIYLGDGKGDFTPSGNPLSIRPAGIVRTAVADFNNDGLKDVALLTSTSPTGPDCYGGDYAEFRVLLNNGNGTFTVQDAASSNITISSNADHLVAGDFNGDGKQDVAFMGEASTNGGLRYASNVVQVLYGKGNGAMSVGPRYTLAGGYINELASADLNRDGKSDLVVSLYPYSGSNTPYKIISLLAKQQGGFYWASELDSINPVQFNALMDLNKDGNPDLAYYTWGSDMSTQLRILPGLGTGKFGSSSLIRKPVETNDIFAPVKIGAPPDLFYGRAYAPNKNVYEYEMLNTSK
jgi:hypothetical protein